MIADAKDLDHGLMHLISSMKFQTVFIMGDHRTGTTILTKILGATGCFNVVTAYDVINFNNLLYHHVNNTLAEDKEKLSTQFAQKGLNQRKIDTINISAETPEEYAFILRNGGYRPQLTPDNVPDLVTLCRKVTFTGSEEKPVLLKNPWDFLNFMFVKEAFPDSLFIFIHRHPVRTINSQVKATRSIFSNRNEYIATIVTWYDQIFNQPIKRRLIKFLFSSRFDLGVRIATRHVCKGITYFLENISKLSSSDYINVRYEDLCASPNQTVMRILDWLNFRDHLKLPYESFIDVRSEPLLPEISRRLKGICQKTKSYLDYFEYNYDKALIG